VIASGPLSGTTVSRSLAHGLSYANVPVATPSRGAPVLKQKLLCDVARLTNTMNGYPPRTVDFNLGRPGPLRLQDRFLWDARILNHAALFRGNYVNKHYKTQFCHLHINSMWFTTNSRREYENWFGIPKGSQQWKREKHWPKVTVWSRDVEAEAVLFLRKRKREKSSVST